MMKQEFINLINAKTADSRTDFNDDNYAIIEKVYMFHPAIDGKDSIIDLYLTFGMTIIIDMLPRAEKIEAVEIEINKHKNEIEVLRNRMAELSN